MFVGPPIVDQHIPIPKPGRAKKPGFAEAHAVLLDPGFRFSAITRFSCPIAPRPRQAPGPDSCCLIFVGLSGMG